MGRKPLSTRGAWYRGWRVISLDGSTLDVADQAQNADAFGRPGAGGGESGCPQLRFVSLVENGTHVLFASQMAGCRVSETALAEGLYSRLAAGMLCLADRGLFRFRAWNLARAQKAELAWRVKKNLRLPPERHLPDGSYLSQVFPSGADWKKRTTGVTVRVIDYQLVGAAEAEPIYRLLTTVLDWERAPAEELAALYASDGRLRQPAMNSKCICGARGSCCAVRRRNWCGKNSTGCCWLISRYAI